MALTKRLLIGLFFCSMSSLYAQKGISYQGVVLYPEVELPGVDSKVTPYSEKDVCFRFSIYDDTNALEYSETHTTTTDYYGQVNLIIGRGNNATTPGRLDDLKWDGTTKYLKVELDYNSACTSWTDVSYDELNYVPFAFYAANSQSSVVSAQGTAPINVTGTGTTTDPVVITFDGGLNNLNDVSLTTAPAADQALIFDGTNWIAGTNDDADADITNEIQDLSLNAKTLELTDDSTGVDLTEVLDLTDMFDVDLTTTTPAENEVLAYEGGLWVNKPLRDLKLIKIISANSASPSTNPIIVGLSTSTNSSNSRFESIDETDIIVMSNNSSNTFVLLESLNPLNHGKVVTIVESNDENPAIEAYDALGNVTKYYTATGNTIYSNSLYTMPYSVVVDVNLTSSPQTETQGTFSSKYESVDFIWYNPTDASGNVSGGYWIPMR
jgi:hypothetical protein